MLVLIDSCYSYSNRDHTMCRQQQHNTYQQLSVYRQSAPTNELFCPYYESFCMIKLFSSWITGTRGNMSWPIQYMISLLKNNSNIIASFKKLLLRAGSCFEAIKKKITLYGYGPFLEHFQSSVMRIVLDCDNGKDPTTVFFFFLFFSWIVMLITLEILTALPS